MKKLFSLLLVVTFLLTSMTGCLLGKPQNNETTPGQETPFGTTPSSPEDQTTPPEETTPEGTTSEETTSENTAEDITTPETPPEVTPPEVINGLTMGTYYFPYYEVTAPMTLTFTKYGKCVQDFSEGSTYTWSYTVKENQVFLEPTDRSKTYVFTILENALIFDRKASTDSFWTTWSWFYERPIIYHLDDVTDSELLATAVMAEEELEALPTIEKIYYKYERTLKNGYKFDVYVFMIGETTSDTSWSDKILGTQYTFTYPDNRQILTYYQGRLLTLNKAFDEGIVTTEMLAELNQKYCNCQIAHSYDDGVITEDVILYTCLTCGETKTVEMPNDFAFSLTWGFDGKYNSQTGHLENGYNYKLGAKCETTLVLTHEELMDVYRLLYNANAFEIKEDFVVGNVLVEPYYDIEISYTINGETIDFTIDGEVLARSYTDWELYPEFGYAYYKIVEFIKSTEEYKALPPNTNLYC